MTQFDVELFLQSGCFVIFKHQAHLFYGPENLNSAHANQPSYCHPEFYFQSQVQWHTRSNSISLSVDELRNSLVDYMSRAHIKPEDVEFAFDWTEPSLPQFKATLDELKKLFKNGPLKKAVPVVFAKAKGIPSQVQLCASLIQLIKAPSTLIPYGWWQAQSGVLGATPEVLFEIDHQQMNTMALAGTYPRTHHSEKSLLESAKNKHEHQLVVEDLKIKLSSFGHVEIGPMQVLTLPSLYHLMTPVSLVSQKSLSALELMTKMHPTAALGVFPATQDKSVFDLLQVEPRRHFGAPLVFRFNEFHSLALVGLRNIEWSRDTLYLGSGCGIVEQSDLNEEWEELKHKRASTLKALGWLS